MDWPDGSGARRHGQRRSESVVEESGAVRRASRFLCRSRWRNILLNVTIMTAPGDHSSTASSARYDDRLVMVIPRLKPTIPEQVRKVLRQRIKSVGDRPLLWSTLGQSLMKHGEWREASLAFRAALKQRPDAFDYAWLADTLDKQHKA